MASWKMERYRNWRLRRNSCLTSRRQFTSSSGSPICSEDLKQALLPHFKNAPRISAVIGGNSWCASWTRGIRIILPSVPIIDDSGALSGRHLGVYLTVIFLLFPFDCEGKLIPRFW